MLTTLDDTLLHQLPTTFGHASSSDRRWFDRMFFSVFDTEGEVFLTMGIGFYLNTNVADGFGAVVHAGRQYNVRASRTLRPDLDTMGVGPVRVHVEQGLEKFRLVLDADGNDLGLGFDVVWQAGSEAFEEPHHFERHEGRVLMDYRRFVQVGRAQGSVIVDGSRIELEPGRSFAIRDHSWGVRPGMGGHSPDEPGLIEGLHAVSWIPFSIGGEDGYVFTSEDREGRVIRAYGRLGDRTLGPMHHELRFHEGSRRIRDGVVQLTDEQGDRIELELESIGPPSNSQGWGYLRGFIDTKSMGAPRGTAYQETDVWDLSDVTTCTNLTPNGITPQNRLWDNRVRLRAGEKTGHGYYLFFVPGEYPRYSFES